MSGSGIIRSILSKHPNAKDIAKYLTPEAIAAEDPEEQGESASYEKQEHENRQEAEGK